MEAAIAHGVKGALKRAVKRALWSPPGWKLIGPRLRKPGVIVLTYHRILGRDRTLPGISVEAFTRQMRWVRSHCEPIDPESLADATTRARSPLPPVLVTFDDGYRDYHDLAYPVLKELGIPAVVFLATSFLDEGGLLWTDRIEWAARTTTRASVRLPWRMTEPPVTLGSADARERLGRDARAHLKTLPDAERRTYLTALLEELDAPPPRERQMLTWDEARRTMDITCFGGHTHTHPILSRLEREAAEREIRTCRERIASETGRAPTLFAYPNGSPSDFTPETQEIVRSHGFTMAFSTIEGIAGRDTDWMAVKRLPSGELDDVELAWLTTRLGRS